MDEKRRAKRLAEESEVTITIVAGGKKYPKGKVIYNSSKDISVSGAKIQSNIFLPIDTLLKIDFKLKNLQQMITAMGKVKWIKIICEDEAYDAGVEFVNTPKEAIQKMSDYISWKQKLKDNKPC
jgi:c-di-GMP-binding flagellar brake protein YcgR